MLSFLPEGCPSRRVRSTGKELAKVSLGQHILSETQGSVKAVCSKASPASRDFYQEIQCMKASHHPNIVKLFQVIDTKKLLFLVMKDLIGGDQVQ